MWFESRLRRRLVRLSATGALYLTVVVIVETASLVFAGSSAAASEMAVVNVTRNADGDIFSISGTDCGPTRCMEASGGTALQGLAGLSSPEAETCVCQCRHSLPTYREDIAACVDNIDECPMATYGSDPSTNKIPFVFLPMKGQIIYPSKEIKFSELSASVCAVTGAQYLTTSGLVILRDSVDQDVPFGLFRDEGKTFLMWLGSVSLRTRLSGRVVVAHVVCGPPDTADDIIHAPTVTPHCAAFRLPGSPDTDVTDVSSVLFSGGPPATSSSPGLSVSESLAVAACALILAAVYAASVIFFVHIRRKKGASRNSAKYDGTSGSMVIADVEKALSANMKTNPLHQLRMDTYHAGSQPSDLPSQESNGDTSNYNNNEGNESRKRYDFDPPKDTKKSHIISAMVHSALRKSGSKKILPKHEDAAPISEARIETLPEDTVSIVDDDLEFDSRVVPPSAGHGRRKLYFNPAFFETRLLKNPPPAAVEFLIKIREVMAIAKEKMLSKRFIPSLTAIQEELPCHLLDLGWDIGSYFNSNQDPNISLKRDNARKNYNYRGCPGCDTMSYSDTNINTRSDRHLCQSCVTEEIKQKIVRKWLENVPLEATPNVDTLKQVQKSIAKVEGTPRSIEPKSYRNDTRNSMPPPPPPPSMTKIVQSHKIKAVIDDISDSVESITEVNVPVEVKAKMKAVIEELSEITKVNAPCIVRAIEKKDVALPKVHPVQPRIVSAKCNSSYIPSPCSSSSSNGKDPNEYETDSLERNATKRRASFTAVELSHKPHYDRFQSSRMSFSAMEQLEPLKKIQDMNSRLSRSYQSFNNIFENKLGAQQEKCTFSSYTNLTINREGQQDSLVNEVYVNNFSSTTPSMTESDYSNCSFRTRIRYSEPITKPGMLTIEVANLKPNTNDRREDENFDPDTLDRKTVKMRALNATLPNAQRRSCAPKPVDKIQLKSSGSFKAKNIFNETENCIRVVTTESNFTRKIGSLREIYQAKSRVVDASDSDFIHNSVHRSPSIVTCILKPDAAPESKNLYNKHYCDRTYTKASRQKDDVISKNIEFYENRENSNEGFYLKDRKSDRRSFKSRNRKTDIKGSKKVKTEDSGYLSTDSSESKNKSKFLLQITDKIKQLGEISDSISDTDDFESLCDGHSESGAESVETNSVFFGNFRKTPTPPDDRLADFDKINDVVITNGNYAKFNANTVSYSPNQIDSGFQGEIIIHSSESDSEHKSIISITMR